MLGPTSTGQIVCKSFVMVLVCWVNTLTPNKGCAHSPIPNNEFSVHCCVAYLCLLRDAFRPVRMVPQLLDVPILVFFSN